MKTSKKFWFAITLILITAILVSSCTCVYVYHLNATAYWWTTLVVGWVIEIVVAIVLFYSKHLADESKAFWLIVLLFLPYYGATIVLFLAYDRYNQKAGEATNLTTVLQQLFSATKSIKIYSDSFFVPLDIFNALRFIYFKDIDIQVLISKQPKKVRNKLMMYNIDKYLEVGTKVSVLKTPVKQNFIIIDDQKVLFTDKNFNFRSIYSSTKINFRNDAKLELITFSNDLKKSRNHEVKKYKLNLFKRIGLGITNIFYLFY